jgi:hypothetical protein
VGAKEQSGRTWPSIFWARGTLRILIILHSKKKVSDFTVPSRDVTYQTLLGRELLNSSRPRERLVRDIPAGDEKIFNLFYSVRPPAAMASARLFSYDGEKAWSSIGKSFNTFWFYGSTGGRIDHANLA